MLNNNNHHSPCASSEQIVSYFYDEASEREKSEIERHLAICSSCSNELAGFNSVRSAINEWREEFLALETPGIEIPDLKQPHFINGRSVSTARLSRLADFYSFFSLSPAWKSAAAAFAVLIVCVGLGLFVFSGSGEEIAVNSNQKFNEPLVSPTVFIEDKLIEKTENKNEPQTVKQSNSPPNSEIVKSAQDNIDLPEKSIVKVSNNAPKPKVAAPKLKNSIIRKEANFNLENKTTAAQKRQVPKLSDFKEEEDNSLRLADLFDEIDSE